MKIKDIPFERVRELAIQRSKEATPLTQLECSDTFGFVWEKTLEGHDFWMWIFFFRFSYALELQPHLFSEEERKIILDSIDD